MIYMKIMVIIIYKKKKKRRRCASSRVMKPDVCLKCFFRNTADDGQGKTASRERGELFTACVEKKKKRR